MIAVMSEKQYNDILPILPSGVVVGAPLISPDGRRAICHVFTDEDKAFWTGKGVAITASLPGDW